MKYGKTPLRTLFEVRFELAKLYREARSGRVDIIVAARLTYMLQVLSRIIEVEDKSNFEARLEALEQEQRCSAV